MKKVKLILFALTVAMFASCEDAINIEQKGELLPEDAYTSVTDLQLGVNGVYASVPGENSIYFTSLFTDEVALGVSNGGQGRSGELAFLLNTGSGDAAAIWASNYAVINRANRIIKGVETIVYSEDPDVAADELETVNSLVAEVRVLRAYANLQLLSYFSEDMTDDNALGVILFDFVPTSAEAFELKLPRSTNAEIYDFINSDLEFADDNLLASTSYKYVTANLVRAIRVRMATYREQYSSPELLTNVNALIAAYGLTPKATYPALFTDTAQGEIIFALERTRAGRQNGNFYQFWSSVNATATGSPFFEVGRNLFNLVNNINDARYNVISGASKVVASNYETVADYKNADILPVGKYARSEDMHFLGDIKVFRVSEMHFIKAEIFASQGNFASVASQLQLVVNARFLPATPPVVPVPANAQAAWAEILKQRRAELSFEGHRYIDLRRLGVKAGVGVDRFSRDCEFNSFCTLDADDYRFVLPIPQTELTANPVIRSQQNPGY